MWHSFQWNDHHSKEDLFRRALEKIHAESYSTEEFVCIPCSQSYDGVSQVVGYRAMSEEGVDSSFEDPIRAFNPLFFNWNNCSSWKQLFSSTSLHLPTFDSIYVFTIYITYQWWCWRVKTQTPLQPKFLEVQRALCRIWGYPLASRGWPWWIQQGSTIDMVGRGTWCSLQMLSLNTNCVNFKWY